MRSPDEDFNGSAFRPPFRRRRGVIAPARALASSSVRARKETREETSPRNGGHTTGPRSQSNNQCSFFFLFCFSSLLSHPRFDPGLTRRDQGRIGQAAASAGYPRPRIARGAFSREAWRRGVGRNSRSLTLGGRMPPKCILPDQIDEPFGDGRWSSEIEASGTFSGDNWPSTLAEASDERVTDAHGITRAGGGAST